MQFYILFLAIGLVLSLPADTSSSSTIKPTKIVASGDFAILNNKLTLTEALFEVPMQYRGESIAPIEFDCQGSNQTASGSYKAKTELVLSPESIESLKEFQHGNKTDTFLIHSMTIRNNSVQSHCSYNNATFVLEFKVEMFAPQARIKLLGLEKLSEIEREMNNEPRELIQLDDDMVCVSKQPVTVEPKGGDLGDIIGAMFGLAKGIERAVEGGDCIVM